MSEAVELVLRACAIGAGATVTLDLWNAFLERAFGVPSLSMGMLGRWFGHCLRGRFSHDSIARAAPVPGERVLGWIVHYGIGITWAGLLPAIWGLDWVRRPTLLPAMIVGIATLVGPFLVMQPGMGLGVFASKAPRPNVARWKSIASHTVFGVGLYGAARLATILLRP